MFSSFAACFCTGKKLLGIKSSNKAPTPPNWRPDSIINKSSDHDGHIARKWKLLMGHDHWEGLLDPLDIDLRRIIIHYGEMAQATYDTFIRDEYSKYVGSSYFSKTNFFAKVGLELGHPYKYKVTKFFYATAGPDMPDGFIFKSLSREESSKETNFMGYVAVAEDESVALLGRREIVVAWRGSVQSLEWVNNLQIRKVKASNILFSEEEFEDEHEAEVHHGWLSIYTSSAESKSPFKESSSARHQVLSELRRLVEQFKDEEISITVTGHSLGASLATLNAVDIVASKINQTKDSSNPKSCLVTAMLFASPRLGDVHFKQKLSKYKDLRILRMRNALDIVPNHPLVGYSDVGEELKIDTTRSPYLKSPGTFSNWHNLEVYLHGLAGTQASGEFKLVVERDIALVNKFMDNLKDEYLVPVDWWVLKNKGMVQQADGSWQLMDHEMDDDH